MIISPNFALALGAGFIFLPKVGIKGALYFTELSKTYKDKESQCEAGSNKATLFKIAKWAALAFSTLVGTVSVAVASFGCVGLSIAVTSSGSTLLTAAAVVCVVPMLFFYGYALGGVVCRAIEIHRV